MGTEKCKKKGILAQGFLLHLHSSICDENTLKDGNTSNNNNNTMLRD